MAGTSAGAPAKRIEVRADAQGYTGSQACAACHGDIARIYAKTAMAQASGRAVDLQLPAGVVKAVEAGARYSFLEAPGPQLHYAKQMADGTVLEGSKNLSWYIGSGAHGRGFVFAEGGQFFQAPIAYYGRARGWDLAPGYEDEHSVLLGRKVEAPCISCHASGFAAGQAGLFQEGAVACERCHGPGARHVNAAQAGVVTSSLQIVNPGKLEPERRDSVCAQCHLTGQTRVTKTGRSEATYRPGDLLADHVLPFVWSSPNEAELKVVGHFEGLWHSKCKRVSGDQLSCLTCHDPHTTVAAAEKSSYYRGKCLGCHQEGSCKLPVAARQVLADSCIACHMPTRASSDGQHTSFTDHSIARGGKPLEQTRHSEELVAFWPERATKRDAALAYANEAAMQGNAAGIRKAHEKLQAVWSSGQMDGEVAAQLEYTEDWLGDTERAGALYRETLKSAPDHLVALTNLATHLARGGQLEAAIALWRRALLINPGSEAAGLNLARAEQMAGQTGEAIGTVEQVLSLHPDSAAALALRNELRREHR